MADKTAHFTVQDKNGIYQFPDALGLALNALLCDPATDARLYGNNGSLLASYGPEGLKVQGGLPVLLRYRGHGDEVFAVVVTSNGLVDGPLGVAPLTTYVQFGWEAA